jgi:hypothetical protein
MGTAGETTRTAALAGQSAVSAASSAVKVTTASASSIARRS